MSKNGAQPGGQFAAAVEMVKERYAANGGFPAVERGVQRVGEFAGVRIAGRTLGDGRGCGVKIQAISGEKMFPGGFASCSARASQGQIFQVKRAKVTLDLLPRSGLGSKALGNAAFERKNESFQRESPAGRLRLRIQLFDEESGTIKKP